MDVLDNIQNRFEECKSSDNEKNLIIEVSRPYVWDEGNL
jgi:hypothetical protein